MKKILCFVLSLLIGGLCFAVAGCGDKNDETEFCVRFQASGLYCLMTDSGTIEKTVEYREKGYQVTAALYSGNGKETVIEERVFENYTTPGQYNITFSPYIEELGCSKDYVLKLTIDNPTHINANTGDNDGYIYAEDSEQLFYFTPEESGDYLLSAEKNHSFQIKDGNGNIIKTFTENATVELQRNNTYEILVKGGDETGKYNLSVTFTPRELNLGRNTFILSAGCRCAYDVSVHESGYYKLDYSVGKINTECEVIEVSESSRYIYLKNSAPNRIVFINDKNQQENIDVTLSAIEVITNIDTGVKIMPGGQAICIRLDSDAYYEWSMSVGGLKIIQDSEGHTVGNFTTINSDDTYTYQTAFVSGKRYYLFFNDIEEETTINFAEYEIDLRWKINGEIVFGNFYNVERGETYQIELVSLKDGTEQAIDVSYYPIKLGIIKNFVTGSFEITEDPDVKGDVWLTAVGYEEYPLILTLNV